jgi:predicted CopG family antitoxin
MEELYSQGFNTINSLYNKLKEEEKEVKKEDVIDFILSKKATQIYTAPKHYNSFYPKYPYEQWQIDIMFIGTLMWLIAVDSFTREIQAVQIYSKNTQELIKAFDALIKLFGGAPESTYSDLEAGIQSADFQTYLENKKIKSLFARSSHSAVVESYIGKLKQKLTLLKESKGGRAADNIQQLIKNHNESNINRMTEMTPFAAKKDYLTAKLNMYDNEKESTHTANQYKVGDVVRIVKKLSSTDKPSSAPRWSETGYKIISVDTDGYKLSNQKKYLQNDIKLFIEPVEEETEKNKVVEQTMANKQALATVRLDKDSTFKPVEGKRKH